MRKFSHKKEPLSRARCDFFRTKQNNLWQEGLRAFEEGWDTYGVEWKRPTPDGPWHHYSGNFWAARADYGRCLSPIAFGNRFFLSQIP